MGKDFLQKLQEEDLTIGPSQDKVVGSPDDILNRIVRLSDELISRNVDSVMKSVDGKRDPHLFDHQIGRLKKLIRLLRGNSRHVK